MAEEKNIARIEDARAQIFGVIDKLKITKFEATALLEQIKAELIWHSYIKDEPWHPLPVSIMKKLDVETKGDTVKWL